MNQSVLRINKILEQMTSLLILPPQQILERFPDSTSRTPEEQKDHVRHIYCNLQEVINALVDARNRIIELSSHEK